MRLRSQVLLLMTAVLLCSTLPAWSQELPEGKGKDIVAAKCNSCHPFFARLGAGYTAKGWLTVMQMMANHGVVLPPDQLATVTEYLTKNFPEKVKPAGVVMAGVKPVSFQEASALCPSNLVYRSRSIFRFPRHLMTGPL